MSSSTIFELSASLTELAYRQMLLNISEVSDICVCHKRGLPCDFSALLSWKVLQSALIQTIKCWAVRTHGLQEKFSLTIHQSSDQLCRLFFIRMALSKLIVWSLCYLSHFVPEQSNHWSEINKKMLIVRDMQLSKSCHSRSRTRVPL